MQRRPDQAQLAGVCAGVADELGAPVLAVRAGFTLAALAGGIGLVAYLLLWLLAPAAEPDPDAPPRSPWPPLAVGLLATGAIAFVLGPVPALIGAAAAGGAALVWWTPSGAEEQPDRGLLRRSAGIGLLGLAAVVFIARQVGLSSLTAAIGAVAVVLGGAALVASPFIVRLVRDRDQERAERLAVRQRAEIAAHLHDSVLQTLSLIQREHTDPDTVLRLARAEERGLRSWLYGQQPDPGQPAGLADQLQDAAAGIEQSEAALIEVVTVGDLTTQTPATDAVVAAAREAMLNAARHSGDPQPVQVFARISPEDVSVFVRDRGVGFDPGTLPVDRGGVRDSIVGRIAHAGGGHHHHPLDPRYGHRGADPDAAMTEPTQLSPPGASPVRVLIVDDHALVRSGVHAQLDGHVTVVGEADDVAAAVEAVLATRPDVVLLDVHLPSGTGADVIVGVGDRAPGTRWLALSISDAPEDVVSVIRAGAHGYLTKSVSAEGLRDAVHRVAEGDAVFSPRLAGFVLDSFRTDPAPQPAAGAVADPDLDSLTTREVEVLTLIARGYTYREAATELYVSVRTIETHVSAVLRKLQLSNRRELARWAHSRDLR